MKTPTGNAGLEAKVRLAGAGHRQVLAISDGIEALLGFPPDDYLTAKVSLQAQFHPDDRDIAEALFSPENLGESGTVNIRLRQANGRIRCLKAHFRRETGPEGSVLELWLQDAKSLPRTMTDASAMANFTAIMENTDDYIYFKDRNHVFTGASQTLVSLCSPAEHWTDLIGQTDYDVFPEELADIYYRLEKQVFTGVPVAHEIQETLGKDGRRGWVDNRKYPIRDASGALIGLYGIARDVTEHQHVAKFGNISQEILHSLNEPGDWPQAMQRCIAIFKTRTGFDAVGMRLETGGDFPYFAQQGLTEDFLRTENTLVARAADGGICRNPDGSACLECTCGLVISGRTDTTNPVFTPGGSFWINDAFSLLKLPVSEDPRLHPRNICIHQGYGSVALIPIRTGEKIVGLIQLNDRRKGCFTLAAVEIMEGIAAHIGMALMSKQEAERQRRNAVQNEHSRLALLSTLEDHRMVESKVREREARYTAMVKSISDAIISADQAGNVVGWNLGAERIFGYPESEILGQPLTRLLPARHHADHLAGMTRVTAGGPRHIIGTTVEVEGRRKDGSEFPLLLSLSEWQIGARMFFTAVMHDITARKQAEAALHESEERYRMLFEANPVPMWLYDIETLEFLAVNEIAVRDYGYTREEFLGMTLREICDPEDMPVLLERIATKQTVTASACALRYRRKDGTRLQVETFSRPLTFAGHSSRLSLVSDVTEKKLLEAKFLHAQRLESIGMLSAGIAHDLNNVLAPIIFAAPLLRNKLSAAPDLRILDAMERSAERGAGLVKQILGFAHTSTGEFGSTQVKHIVRDIIDVMTETFPKIIEVRHQIPTDLWPVQGNATQIHQVLLNLCVNARDAMPQGGTLRLTAANRRLDAAEAGTMPGAQPGAWLMLEVADTGTGIPPEILEHIWRPFFTTKEVGKGTGLGLSTIRGIVITHRGFIILQTEAGHGSIFRVFLPALEANTSVAGSDTASAISQGGGELILLVDDDAYIREMGTFLLEQHGYRVMACVDGVDAITYGSAHLSEIALVVTDVDMPRLGGVAVARTLQQLRPNLRVLAMSGLSHNQTGAVELPEIRKLAHAFLLKPFKPEELLHTVHQLLHPVSKP